MYDYSLEPNLRAQVKALVRRYEELKRDYESILGGSSIDLDGMPHGTSIGDPTGQAAVARATLKSDIIAIETALYYIPSEYREAVFFHIVNKEDSWSDYASVKTYQHWQRVYLYTVAFLKGWIYKA